MDKERFHFNTDTHRFEAIRPSLGAWILRYGLFLLLAVVFSLGIRYSLGRYISNPKEIKLLTEKEVILDHYLTSEERVRELEASVLELQHWDDNIYRSFYEMEPISASLRKVGLGGAERYLNLQRYESSGIMIDLTRRIDMTGIMLDIQANSFTDLIFKADMHRKLIDHRPSIQPISLKDFYWISSVFGYRTDPMSKRRSMHRGADYAGRIGLNVYSTGDGIVIRTKISHTGFGKEVLIDHGFGYVTRYGHMKDILVHTGQKIKRGNVIGLLGSTGKSTGPHLHYEVRHFGTAVNPKHFYSEDLSPAEYTEIVGLARSVNN